MTEATTTILTTGIGILDRDGEREMDGVQDQAGVRIGTRNTDLLLRQVSGEAENSRMTGICHCMGGRAEDCNAGMNLFTFIKKKYSFSSFSQSKFATEGLGGTLNTQVGLLLPPGPTFSPQTVLYIAVPSSGFLP